MPNFDTFHQETLPALLEAGRSALLKGFSLPPMGLVVEGEEPGYTYSLGEAGFALHSGTDGAVFSVTLSRQDWAGLVEDMETVPGLLYGNRLLAHRGDMMQFVRWEPMLRALYTGRPIYDPDRFQLRDRDGRLLNPGREFDLSCDDQEMQQFLDAAGYLLVKKVFGERELEVLRGAARELSGRAVQGDQVSWWGKSAAGEAVLCRCLNGGTLPALAGLYPDPRILRLAGLLPAGVSHPRASETDGVTVVYKHPEVREGLSDLPWHRDCGMGGHALMCPTFVLSIYLFDASPEQGCLQFLPGSHRFSFGFADTRSGVMPGAVTIPAMAGDISLHTGDVMHAAPPPAPDAARFRQSILLSYYSNYRHHRGERHYNDVLLGSTDGQVSHLRSLVED